MNRENIQASKTENATENKESQIKKFEELMSRVYKVYFKFEHNKSRAGFESG